METSCTCMHVTAVPPEISTVVVGNNSRDGLKDIGEFGNFT